MKSLNNPHTELLKKVISIKRRFLAMYKSANAGHIGSALSCAEILTFIQFAWRQPGDEMIMSKGHAAAALYSVLAEDGHLSEDDIKTFYKNDTLLSAHPPAKGIKGIPFATGSLGHGLSLSAGIALAAKFKKETKTVFCLTSDGELNEGSTWEAAQFISKFELTNLVWLIDYNKLQGFGTTDEVMDPNSPDDKLKAFGFEVFNANGHDFRDLSAAKIARSQSKTKPFAIICHTKKGNGWEVYENMLDSHYQPITDSQYEQITSLLDIEYRELSNGVHSKIS